MMGHHASPSDLPRLRLDDVKATDGLGNPFEYEPGQILIMEQPRQTSWTRFKSGWVYFWDAFDRDYLAGFLVGMGTFLAFLWLFAATCFVCVRAVAAAPLLFQLVLGFSVVACVMFLWGAWYGGRQLRQAERTR